MRVSSQTPVRRIERGRRSTAAGSWSVAAIAFMLATGPLGGTQAASPTADGETIASWSMPDEPSLRGRLDRWLESAGIDEQGRIAARQAWDSTAATAHAGNHAEHPPVGRLDRVIAAIGAADPRVATLARVVPPTPLEPDDLADLLVQRDAADGAFFEESVRLHAARHLVRCGLFDDAMTMLAELRPETSVDPATLLFVKATCQHWLLEADAAADTLDRLLERRDELPVRYERLATLMRRDLE